MKRTILLLAVLPFFSFALMAADPILTTKDLSTTPAIAAFNLNYLTGTRKITNNTSFAPTTDYTVEVKAKILSAAVKGFFLETRDAGRNGFRMSINSSGVDNYGALNYTNETAITNVSAVANDAATYHIFRFAVAGTNVHIYRDGAYITSTTTQGIYKDNLLKDNNGNFESTDVSMWNFILAGQGRTTTAGEFNTGAGAVKIKNTGTSTVQSQLTIKGLKPSTSYGFSFYAKYLAKTVNAGNMKYELKLGNYNGSGVFVQTNSGNINNNIVGTPTNTMAAASAVWTLNTQTFSTGAADSIAILDISGWNGDNTYVIDDMVLNETEVTPTVGAATGSNLITNGTFATNITGWSTTASWPFGSIAWASGGGGQLQVIEAPWAGPSNGTYTSSITVSPNKTYKLTAKTSHQNAATQSVTLTDGLVNASTSYSAAAAYAANNITTPALSTIPSTTSLSMKFTTKTGHRTPGQVIMTLDDVILSEYVATYPTYLSYGKAFQSEAANFDIGYINYDVTGAYGPLNYVIAASSSGNGTVSGAATYTAGATVSLTATANSGYSFVDWTEGGSHVSSNATYSFTASAGRTLVANFIAVLTVTGTLSPFSSTYGTASTTQSFTVAGSNLTSDIIVTPPTGFEVSLTSGSGYLSSVTLTQALGSVATTTVYVRLKATAPAATYSAANITINTTGSNQNLSCSGTVATITPNIAFATITSVSKNFGDVAFTNAATSSNSAGAVSYSSGNTAVATVNATSGLVTIESVGSAIITANIATAGNYSATLTTYTLNVAIGNPTLAFTTLTSVSKIIGDAAFTNAASSNFGGPISYISGNTAVATVDASTGLVTIVSAGSAIITANIAATVNYNASSTTYTVYTYNSALFRDNFESYANSANLRTVTIPTYGGSYDDWWISGISVQPGCYLNSKGAKLNGKANASVYMRKTITVTAGHTYTFSALTWCTSTINSLGYEFLTSKVSGGSGSPTIANTWIPQTVTFTAATSENVDVFVYSWVAEIFSDDWLVVDKTPTVTPTVGTYTYTGSAQGPNAATNTGTGTSYTYSYAGVNPTVYTASSTQPTTAGTYTVIATVAADGNYTQASSSATAFTIGKATPTLSVSNSPATYDGTAKSATATALGGGLVSSITTGGTATQTNAGTYTVTADIAASTNYNAATGVTASNSFVIDKATPTLTVSNSPVTYDGTAKSATATASGSGVVSNILTGGAATQTTAGTYTITANIAASTNYNSATGVTASNSFVISKATPTLTVSNTPVTYDGTGKSATATASGSGVVSNISTGGAATQTTAGTYTVTADITASTNYNAATSVTASNSFVISKAIPTLTVSNTPVTYDGTGKSATATASGSGVVSNISTGGAATQTNAGTYTVTADIAASTNYNAATGLTATSSFVIDKATPTLTVTNTPVTYDGTAKSATASASESGVVSNILTGGAATQTTAGTYTVTADIAASTNYNAASGVTASNSFVIDKATPTLTVSNTPVTYDGTAQSATASALGGGIVSNINTGGAATQTNAGTYTVTADIAASTNYNAATGVTASNSFVIAKAAQSITFNSLPTGKIVGNADFAPGASSATSGTNAITYSSSNTAVATIVSSQIHLVGAGNCTIYANQALSTNYNAASQASQSLTVTAAASSVDVTSTVNSSIVISGTTTDVTVSGSGVLTVNSDLEVKSLATATGTQVIVSAPLVVNTGGVTLAPNSILDVANTVDVTGNVEVGSGAKLNFTSTTGMTVSGDLILKADNSGTFSANLGSGGITVGVSGKVKYQRTIDDTKWYFMSFPCDVNVNEITGGGAIDVDWFIQQYNSQKRASVGTGSNWEHVTSGVLTANRGYIFGSAVGGKTLTFLLTKTIVAGESTRTIDVTNYTGSAASTNYGWNLIGQTYLSKYDANSITNLTNMFKFDGSVYRDSYNTDVVHTLPIVEPFAAYFTKVIANATLTFGLGSRQGIRSSVSTSLSDVVFLDCTTATGTDRTNIIMDDTQSASYQNGVDYEKMITTGTAIPQVYTVLGGLNYAYNVLPTSSVVNLPLAIYTKTTGSTTISVDATKATSLSKLLLTDNGVSPTTVTDLLSSNYTFTAATGTNNTRFSITAQRIATDNNVIGNELGETQFMTSNSKLIINNLNANAIVRVYDALGRMLVSRNATSNVMEIKLVARGIYTVQLQNGATISTRKVIF